jgi:hypothetical protein
MKRTRLRATIDVAGETRHLKCTVKITPPVVRADTTVRH